MALATLVRKGKIGELLVTEGVITPKQLQDALSVQARLENYALLGHVLVSGKVVTREQLKRVLQLHRRSPRLGEILVNSRSITATQLAQALAEQSQTGLPVGETLIRLGHATERQVRRALCMQLNIEFIELNQVLLDPELKLLINPRFAIKHLVVPLARIGGTLVVAMDDPTQAGVIDDLRSSTGLNIEVITSTTGAIRQSLDTLYTGPGRLGDGASVAPPIANEPHMFALEDIGQLAPMADERAKQSEALDARSGFESANETLRAVLRVAINHAASDIHLEMVDRRMRPRFRIDGVLQELPLGVLGEQINHDRVKILSRLKILSKLDIAEKRRPQDGSFRARIERAGQTASVDFRISIIPGYYGENAAIRILDPQGLPQSVDALGLAGPVTSGLHQLLQSPTGIILVTGPTGSGKSTTLFAALKSLYRPGIKILTAENPIEYVCDDFSQHEVNERLGNNFAKYLRAFLRHDPDVIMMGEIRDSETAELAFQAAQTGHLVLSTLHTNDAISALTRLSDLGVDSNLVASSLLGVMAQRLVRQVCAECREPYVPSSELLANIFETPPVGVAWHHGRGCRACNFTGYKGRLVLAELWTPTDGDIVLINRGAAIEDIRARTQSTMRSMAEDAAEKLRQGRTSLEELIRALPHATLRGLRSVRL
jgi:type II secretory ATPase GspE/PulE/Tfp pilus assembly ATPase PilB-like protein